MKKLSLLMAMFLLIGVGSSTAQKKDKVEIKAQKEEMEAKKVAFITEKLELQPVEAEKFWAIYHEKEEKQKEIRKEFRSAKPEKDQKVDDMTDAEVTVLLNKGFELKEKNLALDKEYNQKFIDVIGVKKTAKLYHVRNEFRKHEKVNPGPKKAMDHGGK
jgi:hypothetical protein